MPEIYDTYFWNKDVAFESAIQRNRVSLPDSGTGLQICYYDGEPVIDGPENFIGVPFDTMFEYFVKTPNRMPKFLNYGGTDFHREKREEIDQQVNNLLNEVNAAREKIEQKFMHMIRNQAPDFSDPVKRVFLMTSRHTSVIQYSTKGIAKALKRHGYDTKLLIEENDMQYLYKDIRMRSLYEFNPHVTVNINHMYNEFLNENVWNIVWWQDPMPALLSNEPLNVRERDIVFSFDQVFDEFWIQKQRTAIYRQEYCIDIDIFHPEPANEKEEKVVFVGNAYTDFFLADDNYTHFKEALLCLVEKGRPLVEPDFLRLVKKHHIDLGRYPMVTIMHAVIREATVHWLCKESPIQVEIYGPGWEEDELIMPFYKGIVTHGKELADLYRSAKYAMVCQADNIQSQRLVEVAACGAIPVVYDSRPNSSDPLWEEQYLFFRTKKELKQALTSEPKMIDGTFDRIKSRFSYDCLARKIDRMLPKK